MVVRGCCISWSSLNESSGFSPGSILVLLYPQFKTDTLSTKENGDFFCGDVSDVLHVGARRMVFGEPLKAGVLN